MPSESPAVGRNDPCPCGSGLRYKQCHGALFANPAAPDTSPNSLVKRVAKVEPSLKDSKPGTLYQFERVGYFCTDKDSTAGKPVFNRTVQLRDTWAKIEKKSK